MRDGDRGERSEDESEDVALAHCLIDMEPTFILLRCLQMIEHIVRLGHQEVVDDGDGDGNGEEESCPVIHIGHAEDTTLQDKD